MAYESLPNGCPFVVGGGLIRDAILGGRPSDIDVWLPSNIVLSSPAAFTSALLSAFPEASISVVFQLAGADRNEAFNIDPLAIVDDENYGDLNNHWVLEMSVPGQPKVNFMRSLIQWQNHAPQSFFNGIMRAFDIDACMFFVGWMPGQRDINTVIMPQHMIRTPSSQFMMNEIYWNQHRLNNTSTARIESRIIKMCTKYNFNVRTMSMMRNMGMIIPQDQIVATPVPFRQAMRSILARAPQPTLQNQMAELDESRFIQVQERVRATLEMAKRRETETRTAQHEQAIRAATHLFGQRG